MTTKQSDNMRIWDALGKTDPAHTKQFTRSGGFKGTAIKPMWANKQMTEFFGPCGNGWKTGKPEYQVVPAGDEIMVYCTVGLMWTDRGQEYGPVYGVGGDKVLVKQSSGLRTDDEAFKKAYTDALSNAMKFIGVGADVHMGLFDDSKYVQAVKGEFEEQQREAVFAEVERQKAIPTAKEVFTPAAARRMETIGYQQMGGLSVEIVREIPPELDWSPPGTSGIMFCRILDAKLTQKKDKSGELVTVKINGLVNGKDKLFYFHATHKELLLNAIGKVVKLETTGVGAFTHIADVLEVDGQKIELPMPEREAYGDLGPIPAKTTPETEARLLASLLDFDEESLREMNTRWCKGDWTLTLVKLKEEKARREAPELVEP